MNRVRQVFGRCAEHGITLNRKKFVFAVPEVSFCGFKVSTSGYTPDDHLVAALQNFPVPTNRTDVRSFCGLVQQFESFTRRLTELLSPIRALLSPKLEFLWDQPHQEVFASILKVGPPPESSQKL